MSWREQMGQASFRGVKFFAAQGDREGGRRNIVQQFPQKDDPFAQDMGRAVRQFTVDGYVIGDNYLDQLETLLTALEKPGPGELKHPYFGVRQVAVIAPYRVTQSAREGGIARFTILFVETPATQAQPAATVDATNSLKAGVTSLRATLRKVFTAAYKPGAYLASISNAVRSASVALDTALSVVSGETQQIATLKSRVANLSSSASALVTAPGDLFDAYADIFSGSDSSGAMFRAYGFDPGSRPLGSTPSRQQEATNWDLHRWTVQRLALTRAAELIVDAPFDSVEDALAARTQVTDDIDEQMGFADQETYAALAQLRANLVAAIPGDTSNLPHLLTYTPATTTNALTLAYKLYGSTDHAPEIVPRNKIKHPGFILGGRPLEVLSD